MNLKSRIETKIVGKYAPQVLLVENESHLHGGPSAESHFKLTIVAKDFAGMRVLSRHREVYQLLRDELDGGVHALALHTYSPLEWAARNAAAPESPDCRGGSKRQK